MDKIFPVVSVDNIKKSVKLAYGLSDATNNKLKTVFLRLRCRSNDNEIIGKPIRMSDLISLNNSSKIDDCMTMDTSTDVISVKLSLPLNENHQHQKNQQNHNNDLTEQSATNRSDSELLVNSKREKRRNKRKKVIRLNITLSGINGSRLEDQSNVTNMTNTITDKNLELLPIGTETPISPDGFAVLGGIPLNVPRSLTTCVIEKPNLSTNNSTRGAETRLSKELDALSLASVDKFVVKRETQQWQLLKARTILGTKSLCLKRAINNDDAELVQRLITENYRDFLERYQARMTRRAEMRMQKYCHFQEELDNDVCQNIFDDLEPTNKDQQTPVNAMSESEDGISCASSTHLSNESTIDSFDNEEINSNCSDVENDIGQSDIGNEEKNIMVNDHECVGASTETSRPEYSHCDGQKTKEDHKSPSMVTCQVEALEFDSRVFLEMALGDELCNNVSEMMMSPGDEQHSTLDSRKTYSTDHSFGLSDITALLSKDSTIYSTNSSASTLTHGGSTKGHPTSVANSTPLLKRNDTDVLTITRRAAGNASGGGANRAIHVEQCIEEAAKQYQIMLQATKAVDFCRQNKQFDAQRVAAERILLVATRKREIYLEDIRSKSSEYESAPYCGDYTEDADDPAQLNYGILTLSNVVFHMDVNVSSQIDTPKNDCWYLCLVSVNNVVLASEAVRHLSSGNRSKVAFENNFTLEKLQPDCRVNVALYRFSPIGKNERRTGTLKIQSLKRRPRSPLKRLFHHVQKPTSTGQFYENYAHYDGDRKAAAISSFKFLNDHTFNIQNIVSNTSNTCITDKKYGASQITVNMCLNKAQAISSAHPNGTNHRPQKAVQDNKKRAAVGHDEDDIYNPESKCVNELSMAITHNVTINTSKSGFLTVGTERNGAVTWDRRWCHLRHGRITQWRDPIYADGYESDGISLTSSVAMNVGQLPSVDVYHLEYCLSPRIELAPRALCARSKTLLLEFVKIDGHNNYSSYASVLHQNGSSGNAGFKVIRCFLAADTSDEMRSWRTKINATLYCLRAWQLSKCQIYVC